MNIIDYIKSLLPNIKKNSIVEDARLSYAELSGVILPAYSEAEKFFTGWKFRSQVMKDYEKIFKRIVKSDSDTQMIVAISRAMQRIADNGIYMQDRIESTFETEVMAAGMSCIKVNLLRILETTAFASDYSLQFLNLAYICETGEINKSTGYVRSNLSAAELKMLEDRFSDFCFALNAIAKEKSKFMKIIDSIPDVLLDINTGSVIINTIGEDKIDPLSMKGFSSSTNNPIYHIRMFFTERQVAKYKKNKELKKVLEMRLLNLNLQIENNPDAKLEQEIEYTQGRVQTLEHELQKMEEGT